MNVEDILLDDELDDELLDGPFSPEQDEEASLHGERTEEGFEHWRIEVDKGQSSVRVVSTPAPGYRLASIVWSMIDGSASYDITESQTFVMPAMDAVVYVTFQPIA